MSNDQYGFLILDTNPAMLVNDSMHILICSDGILFLKFFDKLEQANHYANTMPLLASGLYKQAEGTITKKLLSNKALIDENGNLKFPVNILYVLPSLKREEVKNAGNKELKEFTKYHCIFKDDLQRVRSSLDNILETFLAYPISKVFGN